MYRFVQEDDFSEWRIVQDKNTGNPWEIAKSTASARVTILAITNDPDIEDQSNISYSGPLMFDIDEEDLAVALASGIELCEKLLSLGVDEQDIEINLSGSKGIHVYLNPKIFCSGRPIKDLPNIYKHMALDLYVPGIDLNIYSSGKGRMCRPPNALRPDNAYKVPVTFPELKKLAAADYKAAVSKPKTTDSVVTLPCIRSAELTKLFNEAKAQAKLSAKEKFPTVPDEVLTKLEGAVPPCLHDLADGNERDQTAFNRVALNVAKFLAKGNVTPAKVASIVERISENTSSKKYNTALSRKRHIQGLISFVKGNKNYQFSCLGMLSVITTSPCKACPIKDDNGVASLESADFSNLFVYKNMGQYYSDPEFQRPITSFYMELGNSIVGEVSGKVEACEVFIHSSLSGTSYHIKEFSEEAWVSKQKFKTELQGMHGVAFLGSDNDVTKLRLTITKQAIQEIGEMSLRYKHSKVGLHYYRSKGSKNIRDEDHKGTRVYVEQDFSLDSENFYNTHMLSRGVLCSPKIKDKQFWEPITYEGNEAFDLLLGTNNKYETATLLGWFLSNHLKSHFFNIEKRYPLLYVSGIAGVGKNSLIAVWMRLACLEGEEAAYTLEAPNSTKLPFQQGLTNSYTIPRVINELNRKSVSATHHKDIIELLKAAFDSRSISKGRIGGGDRNGANVSTVDWVITAPIVTLSEEPLSTPAVLQRGIKVELTPAGLQAGKANFEQLEYRADDLVTVGRWLVSSALDTPIADVIKYLDDAKLPGEVLASGLPERLLHGYKTLLASYDWAIDMFCKKESGMTADNVANIRKMRTNLIEYLSSYYVNIAKEASVNEVDKVLRDMAVLANCSSDPKAPHMIEFARHYAMTEDRLYLDILTIYPILQRFKRSVGDPLALGSEHAFVNSARGLRYFISDKSTTEFLPSTYGRPVCEFDVEELRKANIPVSMFENPDL